jgi:CRP/FNR family cyclic AMP-dependent transcriptional regulator
MKVKDLRDLLGEHAFFQGFDRPALELMAGCAANEHFEAGALVAREGDAADKFYIIRHGQVSIEIPVPARGRLIVQTLHEGDVFDWSWIVPPYRWAFDARADTLVRMVSLDARCLRQKMDSNHELGYHLFERFVHVMASRIKAARLQLLDLYGPAS